ncbi:glycosyltransferase [Seonamhaeicola algicola]|uniref:Glycosyltransferase n=3 Tax=Seonamhaeicola TaxID=1649495 RepID=A0A5C7ATH9_9FLAO|nr:glycosyltransferase [Seonamhaeicola algicola]TXE12020.1 glycosyltransferase [Seonamhaeicola algicola]
MRFLVITNAPTLLQDSKHVAYDPYVREMNIWCKYVDEFTIVSPTTYNAELLVSSFNKQPKVISVNGFSFTSFSNSIKSVLYIPQILFKVFRACKKTDHIHLRCPGNIGLLGCFVQILFPKKPKTAKYAGNWDPKAKQPLSYKLQKWILSNTFLTKNMQVLVYGQWEKQTKNIKPFFTASFYKNEIEDLKPKDYTKTLHMVFVGSLVEGKHPLFTIKLVEQLIKQGKRICLNMYGNGVLKQELQDYIDYKNLKTSVFLHGNQTKEVIKTALKQAHFSILPSKSEGWPKAIAEAMFFGVIPIATKVSCVPYMLDYGKRGILIDLNLKTAIQLILHYLASENLTEISDQAAQWSQQYTLDVFEADIKTLLH